VKVPSQRITFSPRDQEEILQRIGCSLSTGQIAQGHNVQEFEDSFAKHVNAKYAIAVSSGGAAIGIGMRLLEVRSFISVGWVDGRKPSIAFLYQH